MTRFRSMTAVIAAMFVVNMVYALSIPLLALKLADAGVDATLNGINTAVHPLASILVMPFLPRLIAALGATRVMLIGLMLMSLTLVVLPLKVDLGVWFAVRPMLGVSAAFIWSASGVWLHGLADDGNRGRVVALYTAATSTGAALGPLILLVVGTGGMAPFLTAAALAAVACLAVMQGRSGAPVLDEAPERFSWHILWLAPLPFVLQMSTAAVDESFSTFFAIFLRDGGGLEETAFVFMTVMGLGAIAMPYPVGWLSDRMDRVVLTGILTAVFAAGVWVLPYATAPEPVAYVFYFLWGGVAGSLFSIGATLIGQFFRGASLAVASAVFSSMYSVGILAGPPVTGLFMDELGQDGLIYALAAMTMLILPFLFWRQTMARNNTALIGKGD